LHQDSILTYLFFDLGQLFFVNLDEFQVLPSDVVVVLLHFTEGLLVVGHQLVNVLILALLYFVNLDLHAEGEFFLKQHEFVVVILN
jgi:hypothetical protein